jgi:hypothetical protein
MLVEPPTQTLRSLSGSYLISRTWQRQVCHSGSGSECSQGLINSNMKVVTEAKGKHEAAGRVGQMAGFGAFRSDGGGGCSFAARSAVIPAAGSVPGTDHNRYDYPVIAGCGVLGFKPTFCRDVDRSGGRRDRGELLWAECACIRFLRFHHGPALLRRASGPVCISVRRRYPGDATAKVPPIAQYRCVKLRRTKMLASKMLSLITIAPVIPRLKVTQNTKAPWTRSDNHSLI